VSIRIELDAVADEVGRWGFGYLTTVSDDGRPHLLALTPTVSVAGSPVLRFDAGGGRACRNAAQRPDVALMFPPTPHSDGFSLVLDGTATVDGSFVDVEVTSALLHRPAP
jgi:Pyridoxamine 5'-phosphate oxidase